MSDYEVVRSTGDAVVERYVRTWDRLVVELRLWDESRMSVSATDPGTLTDTGTWECDGIVRFPDVDSDGRSAYAVLDTDGNATLRFFADTLTFHESPDAPR